MSLHRWYSDDGPARGDGRVKVTDLGSEHQLVRDGVEQLAHGALVCPGCSMPVAIADAVPVAAELECSYCDQRGRAREFLVRDVYDTATNEVYLIARIG